ncbi:uncharacterized protein [Drosophila takahashii]|uniref:uncharacterized protein isoform X1 n=1 Tax=Drosophila takahashii TaxID=29030 RepID=UPI003898DB0E
MLKKLLSFEQFCEDHFDPNINLTCSEWEELKILVDILEPAFIATQKLQSTQLYMGDFYKLWLELKLTIGAVSHVNSNILKSCIETREEALLGNNAVVCSVYLDPRIRRVLLINPISLMLAKAQLKLLIVQILNIEQQVFPSCSDSPQPSTSSQIRVQNAQPLEESNTCSLLNEFLNTIEVASGDEDGYSEIVKAVHREIDNYNPKPVDVNMNIMEYWETKKFSYPYLFMLAKVVHAVPATKQSTWFASTRTVASLAVAPKVEALKEPIVHACLEKKLLFTIWILAKQESFLAVADRFNIDKSSGHIIFKFTVCILAGLANAYIKWPSTAAQVATARIFDKKSGGIPGVIGAIDGCHILIKQPVGNARDFYNRKQVHFIILQGICDSTGRFIDVFVGQPGRMHDALVFKSCHQFSKLANQENPLLSEDRHLIGDSAYPLSKFLLTPYRDNGHLSTSQTLYNVRFLYPCRGYYNFSQMFATQ